MDSKFNWKAFEYRHTDKSADWYWALWIIAIAIAATAILFKNLLLAILVVVAAFAVSLFAARKPRFVEYEINEKGIVVGKSIMYPHRDLDSFDIEHGQLLIKSQKVMQPLIIIPLAEDAPENEIRAFLKLHLVEEELHEPLSHLIMHYLGFQSTRQESNLDLEFRKLLSYPLNDEWLCDLYRYNGENNKKIVRTL